MTQCAVHLANAMSAGAAPSPYAGAYAQAPYPGPYAAAPPYPEPYAQESLQEPPYGYGRGPAPY
jgi:hypothetical protein